MNSFTQRFMDLSLSNEWRSAGDPTSIAQVDVALNKFSACLRQLELWLDTLERSKLAESESAEQQWLEQLRVLQEQVELQRDAHDALNRRVQQLMHGLDGHEQAMQLAARLDDVNFRWNTARLRALGLRNYAQDGEEHARQLLRAVRELLDWVLRARAQLLQQPPTAADPVALGRQRNQLRVFASRLDEKRPLVESTLMAGRHYLAQQPLLAAASEEYVEAELCKCIRRHIQKLTDKWTELCQLANSRETLLEDVQLKLINLQKQLEDVSLKLHIAEVNKSKFVPVSEITADKAPLYLNDIQLFRSRVLPLQDSIEQVNKLANLISECNVHLSAINLNQLDELNTRWRLLQLSIEERQKALERGIGSLPIVTGVEQQQQQMLSNTVDPPWERAVVSCTQVPYFINHASETTHWDHPKMIDLINSLGEFNEIRYSAYRFALKLRTVQKRLALDLIHIHTLNSVFDNHGLRNDQPISVTQIIACLQSLYNSCTQCTYLNVPLCIDLCLNWMLNLYDTVSRSGTIKTSAFKIGLISLCKATIDEKYMYMFQLICDSNGFADEMRLAHLIHSLIQIPRYLTELTAFGGCNVDFSVRSCLGTANKYEIEFRDFLCWVQREPQSLVWLAVLHRLIHSESARHVNVRCCVCKSVPIVGLRYRCLRCFNTDFCQNCFFYGRFLKGHKLTHPMQEYCSASTSGENVRDLTRIICNKFKSKAYFSRKNLNTGFMPLHGMLIGDEILINGSYDTSFLDQPSAYDSGNMINVGNAKRVMSGTAFAQPPPHPSLSQSLLHSYQASPSNTQSLMDTAAINMQSNIHPIGSATFAPQPYMNGVTSMQKDSFHSLSGIENNVLLQNDIDRKAELEAIIAQLEEENSSLQVEYERLKLERLSTLKRQAMLEDGYGSGGNDSDLPPDFPATLRREQLISDVNVLQVQRERLDERMQQLERHNKQLHEQLLRLKNMLGQNNLIPPLSGCALDKPLPPSNSFGAAAAAAAANVCSTTSILKSSNSLHRPAANKSIHFSNNHVVLDEPPMSFLN